MPYKLRKAPKRELYWVITTETGKKHSKLPIALDKAKAQMRILESVLRGGITPEEKKQLEAELDKIDKTIERMELLINNRDRMIKAIEARDPELKQNKQKHLENVIIYLEQFIKNGHLIIRSNEIKHILGLASKKEYERHKQENESMLKLAEERLIKNRNLLKELPIGGREIKYNGGMVPVRNPMLVLAAEKKARESIKLELDQSNAAVGFANGNYSMEEILQLAIKSLTRKGEAEAIAYINRLIQEHSGNPNFKVKRPEARQQLAREMGFAVGGRKCCNCNKFKV